MDEMITTLSPRTSRFRRSFLTGMRALGADEEEAQWLAFKESGTVDGPFEELLFEGKIDQALSIFRAHAPFGEASIQNIPEILERALPSAMNHKLAESSLQDLLYWVEDEVAPFLETEEARTCLKNLTFAVARDMAHKALTLDEGSMTRPQVVKLLQLARVIARCSGKRHSRLETLLVETLDLLEQHGLLRPARVLLCYDEDDPSTLESFTRRHEADVEAMLLRGADTLGDEIAMHVIPWCSKMKVSVDDALFTFLANPDLEEDERWYQVVEHFQNGRIRIKATLLLLRKASVPFASHVWTLLTRAQETDPAGKDIWDKESRAMEIRQVASKYDFSGQFEFTKHLKMLQKHICARAASCTSLIDFETTLEDARFISASFDSAFISCCVLQMCLLGPELSMDEVSQRIVVALQKLTPSEKYSVCQEFIQHCQLYCTDEEETDEDLEDEQGEMTRNASMFGMATCHYLKGELDVSLCYLKLDECEECFVYASSSTNTMNSSSILNSSSVLVDCDKAKHNSANNIPGTCADLGQCIRFALDCGESDLGAACDVLSDALVVDDIRIACAQSQKPREMQFEQKTFRECPNLLNSRDLVPRLQLAMDSSRESSFSPPTLVNLENTDKETISVTKNLDANGAMQSALRVMVHSVLRLDRIVDREAGSGSDDLVFRLASSALQRKQLDENMILGYLLSLASMDSATLLFKAESKRLNDVFVYLQQVKAGESLENRNRLEDEQNDTGDLDDFDYNRFERLSALGKRLGQAFRKRSLQEDCDRNESLAKWLSRLTERKIAFDRLQFLRVQTEYIQIVGNALFTSLFAPSDYFFSKKKLEYISEFFQDFAFTTTMKSTQPRTTTLKVHLARCVVAILDEDASSRAMQPLRCEYSLLQDSLLTWAKECDRDEIVRELDKLSLTPATRDGNQSTISPSETNARIRLILDLLLELAPENEAYLKRVQLVGGSGTGRVVDFNKLLSDPVFELIRTRKCSISSSKLPKRISNGDNTTTLSHSEIVVSGGSGLDENEKELVQNVCVALGLVGEHAQEFYTIYVETLVTKFPMSSFVQEIMPLLGFIERREEQLRLALLCGGVIVPTKYDSNHNEGENAPSGLSGRLLKRKQQHLGRGVEDHGADRTKGLQLSGERKDALRFAWKIYKGILKAAAPSSTKATEELASSLLPMSPSAFTNLIKMEEMRFVYESWNVPFEEEELVRIVEQERNPMNAVRILFERTGRFSSDNSLKDLYEAGMILTAGNEEVLYSSLKRLVLHWLMCPTRSCKLYSDDQEEFDEDNARIRRNHHPLAGEQENHEQQQPSTSTKSFITIPELFTPRASESNSIFEEKLMKIIVRALRIVGAEAEFLRKFALTTSPRMMASNISRARALKCLAMFLAPNKLDETEQSELWRRERMAELEECKQQCELWRQTPEQIFGEEVDKAQALEGLLRDLVPEKANTRCLQFVAKMIEDFQLYDRADLVEKVCLCLMDSSDEAKYIDVLEVLLKTPAMTLQQMSQSEKIWDGLTDAFVRAVESMKAGGGDANAVNEAFGSMRRVRLGFARLARALERCPLDDVVMTSAEHLMNALEGVPQAQFIHKRMESLKARVAMTREETNGW